MAQHKQLSWSELRVGVFVLAGILVVVVGVFYVTGAGTWGAKYRLVTDLPEVNGLTVGAPVDLDGVEIGNVEAVRMAPVKAGQTRDDKRNVEVVMRINREFQDDIRWDSNASLISAGFVGDRDVNIERGYTGAVLKDGQEIPGSGGEAITVFVRDQGDGIPPEMSVRVFRQFWRGKRRGGTGLGLYIVKGLVEAMDGDITVTHAPGGGAEFRFTVPAGIPIA